MSTKRTIGQIVSVEELEIEHGDEERFEGVENDPELRPSVEQTIQGKVDTNHPDGVGRGLTLAAEERLVARELEIKRTRERYDRSQGSDREAQCRTAAERVSVKRRREFQKRAASVDPWCDPDRRDPREELVQEQLAAVNQQSMRLEEKLNGWSRAAISRRLAERVVDGTSLMSAVVGVYEELRMAPGQVIPIADVQDVNRKEVSIQGRVKTLWESTHPKIQQVGLLEDDTGTIKFTVWRASRKTMVREGETVELESVAKNWYEGRVSVAVTGWSAIHVPERGRWWKA
ncbi:DNA-binding protein (plasmid) [Haladaptatus sp. SPP-AMP-3]|uniref:DNA-binding protein n=1 Tax=Haladaptatus sp. SPP-AMP-3 TaxID=3121295 RepID=UPI003C2E414C